MQTTTTTDTQSRIPQEYFSVEDRVGQLLCQASLRDKKAKALEEQKITLVLKTRKEIESTIPPIKDVTLEWLGVPSEMRYGNVFCLDVTYKGSDPIRLRNLKTLDHSKEGGWFINEGNVGWSVSGIKYENEIQAFDYLVDCLAKNYIKEQSNVWP